MTLKNNFFIKDNGQKLPVSLNDYLLPALSPTTKGTNYWDSKPTSDISKDQLGRIVLQVHQILDVFSSLGVDLNNKNFLDIGTGNGMIPRLILDLSGLAYSIGSDPFLDSEHSTSWQKHDHNKTLIEIKKFIDLKCKNFLDFNKYSKITEYENSTFIPKKIEIFEQKEKNYRFENLGVHEISKIRDTFDIIYCKALEHISNWKDAFSEISKVSKKNTYFYIKHRSFFSYLGPHRYSSIEIPWGHLLLTDHEFKRFISEFHENRMVEMDRFYFNDLTYPRKTVSDMIKIAYDSGFYLHGIKIEPPKYREKVFGKINDINNFWLILKTNFPSLNLEEMFSGIYHIVFKKV
jgi:hypothetical protein